MFVSIIRYARPWSLFTVFLSVSTILVHPSHGILFIFVCLGHVVTNNYVRFIIFSITMSRCIYDLYARIMVCRPPRYVVVDPPASNFSKNPKKSTDDFGFTSTLVARICNGKRNERRISRCTLFYRFRETQIRHRRVLSDIRVKSS